MNVLLYCPHQDLRAFELSYVLSHGTRNVIRAPLSCSNAIDLADYVLAATDRITGRCGYDVILVSAARDVPGTVEAGLAFIMRLRAHGHTIPLVVITDGNVRDETQFLERGASYCFGRPELPINACGPLLCAILASVTRPVQDAPSAEVSVGGLILNTNTLHLWYGKKCVRLTLRECALLEALMRRPGWVVTRDQLITAMRGPNVHMPDRDVDSHIKRIRGKMRKTFGDATALWIETVYGSGYSVHPARTAVMFPVLEQTLVPERVAAE